MKRILSLIILLLAVCSFSFAATCTTNFSGPISSDGTGNPGTPISADLTTGCGCGTINSITITTADLGANCNQWYLYDITYNGTGGTTLTGVCAAAITNLVLPSDATSLTFVQYDCCNEGAADNVTISFDVEYDFTDDGTCPPPPATVSCINPTPICTDQGLVFPASVNVPDASTTNPNVGYGCLSSQPNPEWFYVEIAAGGILDLDINNSAANDVDWAAWGPFTSLTQLTTNCSSGAAPFDAPIDCDFTGAGSGTITLGTVAAGSVYAILVNNFDNAPTNISIQTAAGSTASTDCSIVVPGTDCAATCADASTNSCNLFVTATNTPITSYAEIQAGGGESCLSQPLDVSTTSGTIVQCFNYTHNTPGSTQFDILSGISITETNDTNGTNDCNSSIDQVELFDSACNSLGFGSSWGNVSQGASFTICVTVSADNGTAEGNCVLNCLAHSVTPVASGSECAATCADASTNACNVSITQPDTPPTTYGDIQVGGGESCFLNPIDVSVNSGTVTQCFNYTHSTPGSSEFFVLNGASILETNDTNGTNDCDFTIDQLEFFDGITCASIGTTAAGGGLTSVPQGASFTICATITANNGTAEGDCVFQCIANSITPVTTSTSDCAATCAAATTSSCNHYETAVDTPIQTYTEIQNGGGESCFTNPIDVTNGPATVTQCFTYTHTATGSDAFGVLSGLAITELNDTNGTNDCGLAIDSIEIFDQASCTSFGAGPQGVTITGVSIGDQFTICVTGTADNATAEGNCTFECMAHSVTPLSTVASECAATCAAVDTAACNVFVTIPDTPPTTYPEIQNGGGESCFDNPIDVSTTAATVTQCFEYTHNTPGSSEFSILPGVATTEIGDTNGNNDCNFTIDNIEIFDEACGSFGTGTGLTSAIQGVTYTICVTATADNGNAEGSCTFDCMAHSVTPITAVCDETFAFTVDDVCSGEGVDFVQNAGCDAGPGNIDLDFYVYAPGNVAQEAPVGYDPLQGNTVDTNYPISNTDLVTFAGVGPTYGGTICDDALDAITFTNRGCGPAIVSFFVITWDFAYDTDVDSTFGEYNNLTCATQRYDVTIYPSPLQTEVTNDGSTCGLPQVVLVAEDSTVCETITGSQCSSNGDALNYDFSTTPTATALANAPAACALPTLTGTITCSGCTITCGADGGITGTTDPTTICVDGVPDPIEVTVTGNTGTGGCGYIITDNAASPTVLSPGIVQQGVNPGTFDLDGAGAGTCRIWSICWDGTAPTVQQGDLVADIAAPDVNSCFDLSGNSVDVIRENAADAGTVSTTDPTTICVDGVPDPIDVDVQSNSSTGNCGWIITDNAGNPVILSPGIIQTGANPGTFDLDGAGVGTCNIWSICWNGTAPTVTQGSTVSDITQANAASCYDLSASPVTVIRQICQGPQDCATLIANGTDICTVIVDGGGNLDPNHPLASQDCDMGGIDNYTECLSGEDPSDPMDDCTAAEDESVDICAIIGSGSGNLVISGIGDGPLSGGTPKFVELYVVNNIADLSIYGLESANNGNGTSGVEFTFPAVAATAGTYIYVATSTAEFSTWFGFAPDYVTTNAVNVNGDDAVALYESGVVVDVFGDVNVDGTGTGWEYTDGYAYRNNNTGPSATFVISEWTYSGIDAWDGESDNASASDPFPTGTFTTSAGGGMLGSTDCDGDGVTNADECTDGTDPFDPCDYDDGSITGPVTADQTGCACPDLSPILNLLPNNISGVSNINVIAEVFELGGVDTDGSLIKVRMPSDPRLVFTYDPTLTNIGFNSVNNSDWNYVGDNGVVHEFTYIPSVLTGNARSAYGFIGTYDPQSTDGQTTLTVTIVPLSGGECVFTNNTDAETLIYFD